MILIPVKNLKNAKQRLAAVLDQSARTELAQAMLTDVLETVNSCANRLQVSLVTSDPFAIALAKSFDLDVISDSEAHSETEAIAIATRACEERGDKFTLVIPADIPVMSVSELETVLRAAPLEGSVLVPSSDKRGTNAVLRRPCGLFPLRFGNDSFAPHLASAKSSGKPCIELSLPGIGLDIDNPTDLRLLAEACGEKRSQILARQWNFSEVPQAANGR